jgi:hypothetical protein
MVVSFPSQKHTWNGDRMAVAFPAKLDGRDVTCLISWEAMQDAFQCHGAAVDVLAHFESNRRRIEAVAEREILAGRFEADGFIVLRSGDF